MLTIKYGNLPIHWKGEQNYDRVIEAAVVDIYTHEKAFINVILLWQPKNATGPDILELMSCALRAAHLQRA